MADYWKSTPKYWCKHCQTFVADTPLSKKNHEATAKHQLALKHFLRDLHRTNERERNASDAAKREVERLNNLVGESSSSLSAAAPTPSVAKPEQSKATAWGRSNRALTATEQKRQMKELEALGVAMPEEFRGDLAMPGEWQTVAIVEEGKSGGRQMTEKEKVEAEIASKRKREEDEEKKWKELDEDERAMKGFKIQTRSYPGADNGEEIDVGALFKKRKKSPPVKTEDESEIKKEYGTTVKADVDARPPDTSIKREEGADSDVVFKKRKAKSIRKKE